MRVVVRVVSTCVCAVACVAPAAAWAEACSFLQFQHGATRSCTMPGSGCTGVQICDEAGDNVFIWGPCGPTCTAGTTGTCTVCGRTGTGTCTSSCGVSNCTAYQAETCNNCDDNGNGQIDDGLTQTCTMPNGCTGHQTCSAGQWSTCGATCSGTGTCTNVCGTQSTGTCQADCSIPAATCGPAAEVCNNCDDNQNGVVDDGLSCQPCNY